MKPLALATLLLLGLTSAASAECAWVLWSQNERSLNFHPVSAYGSIEECDSALDAHGKRLAGTRDTYPAMGLKVYERIPGGDHAVMAIRKDNSQAAFYTCFPSIVDPNGSPKVKP